MEIWSYFSKIICINLPKRTDRRELAKTEFSKYGIPVQFFDAIQHLDGRIGLQMTLLKIFKDNYLCDNLLIFEDDVLFINDPVNKLRLALYDLPPNFDMLYFGANRTEPCLNVTSNLKLLHNALACHAVCYANRMFFKYIRHLYRVTKQGYIATDLDISDVFLTSIQADGHCYMVNPIIATQRPGYSDIEKRETDYSFMQRQII